MLEFLKGYSGLFLLFSSFALLAASRTWNKIPSQPTRARKVASLVAVLVLTAVHASAIALVSSTLHHALERIIP